MNKTPLVITIIAVSLVAFAANAIAADNSGDALRLAARDGRITEVKRLIAQGASVNARGAYGETALQYAARFGFRQVVAELLDHGAAVDAQDSYDDSALIKAAKNSSQAVTALILRHDPNVNLVCREGKTALHYAAMNGNAEMVAQLVRARGADLSVRDARGYTALDYALEQAQAEVGGPYTDLARILRKAGAKTNMFTIVRTPHSEPELAPAVRP